MTQKYNFIKDETIRRIERVCYIVEIPDRIKHKRQYAKRMVEESGYLKYEIADILDSELLDEEFVSFGLKK